MLIGPDVDVLTDGNLANAACTSGDNTSPVTSEIEAPRMIPHVTADSFLRYLRDSSLS